MHRVRLCGRFFDRATCDEPKVHVVVLSDLSPTSSSNHITLLLPHGLLLVSQFPLARITHYKPRPYSKQYIHVLVTTFRTPESSKSGSLPFYWLPIPVKSCPVPADSSLSARMAVLLDPAAALNRQSSSRGTYSAARCHKSGRSTSHLLCHFAKAFAGV